MLIFPFHDSCETGNTLLFIGASGWAWGKQWIPGSLLFFFYFFRRGSGNGHAGSLGLRAQFVSSFWSSALWPLTSLTGWFPLRE